ncbi:MAG: DNA polymerase III subunit beta [Planctomycetota bacterium]
MKVTCDREKLREGLAIVNGVVPTKSTKPILENVYLVATDHTLELVGSDQEVSVRYRIDDVEVADPGPALVPARVAFDFVRDLSGETITLDSTSGTKCILTSGADRCELVVADHDEYSPIARFEDHASISVQGGNFTRLVGRTAFAAAREPGRYAMHGVLVLLADDKLTFIGTDGRRLSKASIPVDMGGAPPCQAIVPTKGMQLFCRVIQDPLDQIHFVIRENQVGLRSRNAETFARLIDGEYPRYESVIPAHCSHSFEADPELLGRKLRLVANVSGDEQRAVRLRLRQGELELFGRASGRGNATANLEVDYKGEETEIAFNPEFVLDGLKNGDSDRIRVEFENRTSPGKFLLGEEHIYIVMPITFDA